MTIVEFPTTIMIEPTNLCNSRCPLCPTGAGVLRRTKGFMSLPLFRKLIDEIKGHTTLISLWHYGEPFLHPEIFKMIRYAAECGITVVSSTNGYAFNEPSSIENLAHSGLSKLIVSIDGSTNEINSQYRKGVDLNRVLSGMDYFLEITKNLSGSFSPPKLAVQMIAFKHNINDINAIRELANFYCASFEIKTANLNMVPGIKFESYLPDQGEYQRYIWEKETSKWRHAGEFINRCSFVETGLAINWDGTVNPCCYDYQAEYHLGNANEQSLSEIWAGLPLFELRQKINTNRAALPICAICGVDRPQRRLSRGEK